MDKKGGAIVLSQRQKNLLRFVAEYWGLKNHAPSFRDIGEALSISSTSVVAYHVDKLERKGLLAHDHVLSRTVRLTELGEDYVPLDDGIRLSRESIKAIQFANEIQRGGYP